MKCECVIMIVEGCASSWCQAALHSDAAARLNITSLLSTRRGVCFLQTPSMTHCYPLPATNTTIISLHPLPPIPLPLPETAYLFCPPKHWVTGICLQGGVGIKLCLMAHLPMYLPTYPHAYLPTRLHNCLPSLAHLYLPICLLGTRPAHPPCVPACLPAFLPACLPACPPANQSTPTHQLTSALTYPPGTLLATKCLLATVATLPNHEWHPLSLTRVSTSRLMLMNRCL